MTDTAYYCHLSHESLLAVRGPDAAKFLQGQITCNLDYLNEQRSSLGARCTAKGRMLSSFRIVKQGDGYLLAMASELLEAQLVELKKYAVFSKVTLSDESAAWTRFGLNGADTIQQELGRQLPDEADAVAHGGDLLAVRLSDGRVELWVPSDQAARSGERLASRLSEVSLDTWLLAQVRAGIGQVFGPTRELFIPQMINLQALGGVSFKKGCYTGQEIVARMQYLGKLKRRLYHLGLEAGLTPAPGTELFSPVHGSSVGEVVLAATTEGSTELLAVVQEDAATDGRLHLGAADGPALSLLALPYTLDKDKEIQH
jgi:folate-binding protein YgfZ